MVLMDPSTFALAVAVWDSSCTLAKILLVVLLA